MKRIAVYAGTFDPPTKGHLWMIQEASRLFDKVIVSIGLNPEKTTSFSIDERLSMLVSITQPFSNVQVDSFNNRYLVNYAASVGANFVIRGIRNSSDAEFERAIRYINSDINKDIAAIFLMPPREIAEVASSVVKGLVGPVGWERVVSKYVPIVVLKSFIARQHSLWKHLQALGATGCENELWEEVLAPYMSPERAYHNHFHICDMLAEFAEVKHLLKNPTAVEMAIWCHDLVYDPFATDNEEKSGKRAKQIAAKFKIGAGFGEEVYFLILPTKHSARISDPDAQFLADMDLAIFAQDQAQFDEYERGIRAEYVSVPLADFTSRRAEILQSFLDRPSIYHTAYFRTKYELPARANLVRSIRQLRS